MKTSKAQLAAIKKWQRENPEKQAQYVRDWEKKNPEQAQARKNAYWKTAKGKAVIKRRRKKFNAYRKRWRAQKAKSGNAELSEPGGPAASESTERVAPPGFAPVTGSASGRIVENPNKTESK